eukprot:m.1310324 g.1310324  ORF g.1310324 m.1310324 type:complete len:355 (-) comp24825_c0_seq6:4143-5207(-)
MPSIFFPPSGEIPFLSLCIELVPRAKSHWFWCLPCCTSESLAFLFCHRKIFACVRIGTVHCNTQVYATTDSGSQTHGSDARDDTREVQELYQYPNRAVCAAPVRTTASRYKRRANARNRSGVRANATPTPAGITLNGSEVTNDESVCDYEEAVDEAFDADVSGTAAGSDVSRQLDPPYVNASVIATSSTGPAYVNTTANSIATRKSNSLTQESPGSAPDAAPVRAAYSVLSDDRRQLRDPPTKGYASTSQFRGFEGDSTAYAAIEIDDGEEDTYVNARPTERLPGFESEPTASDDKKTVYHMTQGTSALPTNIPGYQNFQVKPQGDGVEIAGFDVSSRSPSTAIANTTADEISI